MPLIIALGGLSALTGAAAVPLPPPRPDLGDALLMRGPVPAPTLVPLPPPRPPEQGPPVPEPMGPPAPPRPASVTPVPTAPPTPALPSASVEEERVCAALLASGKVVARASEAVGGPSGCGMAAPVEVSAIRVDAGRQLPLTPPVEVNCAVAGALADWVTLDLVPLFDKAGLRLTGLTSSSGYSCRGRNRIAGAKLSEHGLGNAVDIGGFATEGKGVVGVKDARSALLADVKRTACDRFTTVLGPGSDSFHESHLHVDLAGRHNGLRLCQWNLP